MTYSFETEQKHFHAKVKVLKKTLPGHIMINSTYVDIGELVFFFIIIIKAME